MLPKPEKNGMPIMGMTAICASRNGAMPYRAPRTATGPGMAGANSAYPTASVIPIAKCPIQPRRAMPPIAPASMLAGFIAGRPMTGAT